MALYMEKKKILVAMSGGVDSSVSAALLKQEGHDVSGAFIRTWYPEWLNCDWRKERQDAMRACAHLGIPFTTVDLSKEYKEEVIDYMIAEYSKGRTPNPDVMCNKSVKFGAFLAWTLESGYEMIATGHYARLRRENPNEKFKMTNTQLLAGVDEQKDQSYFLWTITQDILKHTLFPIGKYKKGDVRKLAKSFDLHNAEKKDSQGLCFIGHVDIREFLKHYIDVSDGDVLNEEGNVIGSHEGALMYTIGQRHGFEVTKKTPDSGPYYVVSKDIDANTLTVSESFKTDDIHTVSEIVLEDINWIEESPQKEKTYGGRIRYRQVLQDCTISENLVTFSSSQRGVSSGQSVVIYDAEVCMGGGVISRSRNAHYMD